MISVLSKVKISVKQFWAAFVFIVISTLGQLVAPSLVSTMISDGVGNNDYGLVIGLAVAIIAVSVLAFFASMASTLIASKITTKFCAELRQKIFHKVQTFSSAEIDKFGTASLTTRNTTDVTTIQNFLTQFFKLGLMGPLMAIAGVIMCIVYSGRVAVVLAIAVPVMLAIMIALLVMASRYSTKLRTYIDKINPVHIKLINLQNNKA